MTAMILLATHLLAAALGGLIARWLVLRYVCAREVEGHIVLELNEDHLLHRHHDEGDPMADDGTSPMSRGERGPKGDHGQDGRLGQEGSRGRQGEAGAPGRPGRRGASGEGSRRLWLFLLIASLIMVGIGVQTYLGEKDDRDRDRDDREYAECMTEFAKDLVDAIEARSAANLRIESSRERKDRALDELLAITQEAQQYPDAETQADLPPGLIARYERVLDERIRAQREYRVLVAKARATREANPYRDPQVVCER